MQITQLVRARDKGLGTGDIDQKPPETRIYDADACPSAALATLHFRDVGSDRS